MEGFITVRAANGSRVALNLAHIARIHEVDGACMFISDTGTALTTTDDFNDVMARVGVPVPRMPLVMEKGDK